MGTKHYPVQMFSDGMDDLMMDEKTLKTTPGVASLHCHNDNNVERISQFLLQNRHLSLRMLADKVNIGKDTVRKIVVEDLGKHKICSPFAPHSLTLEQKNGELQLAEI